MTEVYVITRRRGGEVLAVTGSKKIAESFKSPTKKPNHDDDGYDYDHDHYDYDDYTGNSIIIRKFILNESHKERRKRSKKELDLRLLAKLKEKYERD